jgi:hypothetical protein
MPRQIINPAHAWSLPVLTAIGAVSIFVGGCGDTHFLDTGDTLIATFEPGFVYVEATAPIPSPTCVDTGGARLRLLGVRTDGSAAGRTKVQLWLSGPVTAALSASSIELDDDGADSSVCFAPGSIAGTATLHARSGVVETTATIQILARVVPAGGSLVVAFSAVTGQVSVPPSSCGAPTPASCSDGGHRSASIVVEGLPSDTASVPEGAAVVVSTDFGWLTVGADCQDPARAGSVKILLASGMGQATICFPDTAGTATVTAHSAAVTASAHVDVPTIPRSIELLPNRTMATAGAAISFVAFVSDCAGHGVAGAVVAFDATSGGVVFDGTNAPVTKSGADGLATINGTISVVPAVVVAELLGMPQVACSSTIAAGMTTP